MRIKINESKYVVHMGNRKYYGVYDKKYPKNYLLKYDEPDHRSVIGPSSFKYANIYDNKEEAQDKCDYLNQKGWNCEVLELDEKGRPPRPSKYESLKESSKNHAKVTQVSLDILYGSDYPSSEEIAELLEENGYYVLGNDNHQVEGYSQEYLDQEYERLYTNNPY